MERIIEEKPIAEELSSLVPALERKGLVMGGRVTEEGKKFYAGVLDCETHISHDLQASMKKLKDQHEDYFDKWWNTYPRNSTFEYKGQFFQGTRALRTGKKEENKKKFLAILAQGTYTGEQLLKALDYEVESIKKESHRTGDNKMRFMPGSLVYLNNNRYESFIGMTFPEDRDRRAEMIGI